MTIEKLEEFASNGDKHLTGLDVATGFPRADKPERPWFNKLFGDITGKINEVVDSIDELPPFEDGVLADTFVVVDGSTNQRAINRGLESVAELSDINNPKTGLRVYVKSYHNSLGIGGGWFVYDSTKAAINDFGVIINGWVREGGELVLDPVMFGAKADGVTDDRLSIQLTIDYLYSIGGGEVLFGSGEYLVNSYTTSALSLEPTYDIIMMQPNVSFKWEGNSKFIVGNFFDDNKFHVFSGYLVGNTVLTNVHFRHPYITSFINENHMKTKDSRRVAIEFRDCDNVSVYGGTIRDLELSNGVGAGVSEGTTRKGKNAHIYDMNFINLVKDGNKVHIDHTTIYLNAQNSSVYNCRFIDEGDRGWEISCPVELHASNTSFTDSYVYGYTRGGWFVADGSPETSVSTSNQKIANNKGVVAHTVAQVWITTGKTLNNCVLKDNVFELNQPDAGLPEYFIGQALLSTSGTENGNGSVSSLFVEGNTCYFLTAKSEEYKKAIMFDVALSVHNLVFKGNTFYGVNGGASIDLATLTSCIIKENTFITTDIHASATTGIFKIKAGNINNLSISDNLFSLSSGRVEAVFKLEYTSASSLNIGRNKYSNAYSVPVVADYYYPQGFDTISESTFDNTWYNKSVTIPTIETGQSVFIPNIIAEPYSIPLASKVSFAGKFGYPILVQDGMRCGTDLSSVDMYLTNVGTNQYTGRTITVDCRVQGST